MIKKPLSVLILISVLPLMLQLPASYGQDPAAAPDAGGPVDIQANEQDFVGDQVVAHGNVHVTYKDTVITAPQAVLTRNEGGSPQSAVFTGYSKMVQHGSSMAADKLTFDIAAEKILAEGNSHSEIISNGDDDTPAPGKTAPTKPAAASTASGAPERIITDADRQEYERSTDKFEAQGHVRVIHGDIHVSADKLQLVYGVDKKPETAIFTGRVTALQGKNNTQADNITYSLTTRRLQATGHVRSKVIQEKKEADATPVSPPATKISSLGPDAAMAATTPSAKPAEEVIIITSDAQDYSKVTGRTAAEGNVKVYYDDTTASGPSAILVRNEAGKAERVIFPARSQITQPGKRWVADHITLLVENKKVIAEGNTKAFIIQDPSQRPSKGQPVNFIKPVVNPQVNAQIVARPANSSNNAISSRKVEATK